MNSAIKNKSETLGETRARIESEGYRLIGISAKNPVPLNKKHRKKVEAACRELGVDVALYDNGRRIFCFLYDG